jgi:hypothetical protein
LLLRATEASLIPAVFEHLVQAVRIFSLISELRGEFRFVV